MDPWSFGPSALSDADRHRELARFGPIIDFVIRRGGDAPLALNVRGLIDTGASVVCIDRKIARKLELRAVNIEEVSVAGGGRITSTVYEGVVSVPELQFELDMPLYAANFLSEGHNVLLGRAFLKHFIVTFDGPRGVFHFSRPASPSLSDPGDDFAT